MRKRILLSAYIPGSLHALRDYFHAHITQDHPEIKLIFHDHYKTSQWKHFLLRIIERLRTYDLSLADYPSRISCRGKVNFYISHGYGTKCSPGKDEYARDELMSIIGNMRKRLDALITMSEWDATYYWRAPALNDTPYPHVLPYGLPRNDCLFDAEYLKNCRMAFDARMGPAGKFLLLYAPTWRGYPVEYPFFEADFVKLNEQLKAQNAIMLYRPHYIENLFKQVNFSSLQLDHILLADMKAFPDTAELLCASDMLLTDYSSIYADYLATQRPIAYLALDIGRYDAFRGLVVNFQNDDQTPGPKLQNLQGVVDYVQAIQSGEDAYTDARKRAQQHFFTYPDGHSAQRIWDAMLQALSGQADWLGGSR